MATRLSSFLLERYSATNSRLQRYRTGLYWPACMAPASVHLEDRLKVLHLEHRALAVLVP